VPRTGPAPRNQYNQNILNLLTVEDDRGQEERQEVLPVAAAASYEIEAIVSVDERGQMVLPKQTRARAGIRAGDKLALVGWRKGTACVAFR